MASIELIGWTSSIFLAICSFPQMLLSLKQGHSKGLSWWFLILWSVGELFGLIYVLPLGKLPLILNYFANVVFMSVIMKYKIWPRKQKVLDIS